jgi:trimeric autotransporter adhesin
VFAGGRVFVGGNFRTVNGISRPGLAALDPASGALLPWDARLIGFPNPPGAAFTPSVFRLAEAAGRLYVSGLFTEAGGAARVRFAVLDVATGNALPGVLTSTTYTVVNIAATATRVYLAGDCGPAGIVVCAYGADMTPLSGWTFPVTLGTFAVGPTALFTLEGSSVGPPYGATIVARDLDSGSVLPFTPPVLLGAVGTFVNALTVAGNTVYAAGSFVTVNGQRRTRIAAMNATTGALLPWAPLVGGDVRALAVAGSRVAFGGSFRITGGIAKRNLVALDMRTGRPCPSRCRPCCRWAA